MLELIAPAGFEDYFREVAPLLAVPGGDAARVQAIAGRYGLKIDFATVPQLAERHGLRLG